MADKPETVEVVKVRVVKLTEMECEKQLQYLREIQNVVQVYAGEINDTDLGVAIRELIQIGHMVEAVENLLATAIKERLYEESLLVPVIPQV